VCYKNELTNVEVEWAASLQCIEEIPASFLSLDTGHPDNDLLKLSHSSSFPHPFHFICTIILILDPTECGLLITFLIFFFLALQPPLGIVLYSPLMGFSLLACEVS